VFLGGSKSDRVAFEWMFFVVRGEGRTILVDAGFSDPQLAKRWKLTRYATPVSRLTELRIAPGDVTDVILTHAHWDHMGSIGEFENARVWIQDAEYQYASRELSEQTQSQRGMRWVDFQTLLRIEEEERLERVDGDRELYPGVTVTAGGGHTPGSQYVTVNTLNGPIVIAGDTTYMYKNNTRHIPIGTYVNSSENLRTIHEMQRKAASPFLILPGHDPKVMSWFPEVAHRIVRITSEAR
jgi:glyoxylase-like metal-dependent hydrolase (beta-lactamase superfamily II)